MSQYDAEALAGQTFYRAVAAPSTPGSCAYVGLQAGPDVQVFLDAVYVWPGLPGASAEIGIIHYNTPFDQAPFTKAYSTFLVPNHYGKPNSKSTIWAGNYPTNVEPQIDYIFQGPNNNQPGRLEQPPYTYAILDPNDMVVFWMSTPGFELKVGLWIREMPWTPGNS